MRTTKMARWIALCAIAVVSVLFPRSASAQETVKVGVGVDPVFTPWWVAKEKGFFKKYEITAELTQFSGGPAMADATMAGEMDIGSSGTATWMPRIVRGSMVVLATMATSPDALKLASLTSIKSLADLKGKKVGTVGGSTTDYLWVLTAKKLNVPETAIDVIPMTPPALVPSLDRGDIVAYYVWEPWATRAIEVSGKDKVHILGNSGDVGYNLNFVVVANKKFVDAKPKETEEVLAALRDAINWQNANPVEAAAISAKANRLKPEMASYIMGLYKFSLGLTPDTITAAKAEEAWMRSKERLKGAAIDWSKTIDRKYLDQAMTMK